MQHAAPPPVKDISQGRQKVPPLRVIRPRFDDALAMVQSIGVAVVGVPIVTVLGGTLFYMILSMLDVTRFIGGSYIFGLIFIAALVAIPPLFFEVKRAAYRRTVFNFYADYVDFQYFHFLVSRRRGRLRFTDIDNVTQQANALQEQRKLTTVTLYAASMQYSSTGFAGLKLTDLPGQEDYFSYIMDVIDKSRRSQQVLVMAAPVPATVSADANTSAGPIAAADGNPRLL